MEKYNFDKTIMVLLLVVMIFTNVCFLGILLYQVFYEFRAMFGKIAMMIGKYQPGFLKKLNRKLERENKAKIYWKILK